MEEFKIGKIENGRPNNIDNPKEKRCYDILDNLNIEYQRVEYNFFPSSIDDLRKIDEALQVEGIKNLIFRTKNKSTFYFIIIPREERFDEKAFRNKFDLPKISMAKPEDLNELLKTHSGAVSIMELENDEGNIIKLFIDERILKQEYFRFHPNENKSTVRIRTIDFKDKLMPYLTHEISII